MNDRIKFVQRRGRDYRIILDDDDRIEEVQMRIETRRVREHWRRATRPWGWFQWKVNQGEVRDAFED